MGALLRALFSFAVQLASGAVFVHADSVTHCPPSADAGKFTTEELLHYMDTQASLQKYKDLVVEHELDGQVLLMSEKSELIALGFSFGAAKRLKSCFFEMLPGEPAECSDGDGDGDGDGGGGGDSTLDPTVDLQPELSSSDAEDSMDSLYASIQERILAMELDFDGPPAGSETPQEESGAAGSGGSTHTVENVRPQPSSGPESSRETKDGVDAESDASASGREGSDTSAAGIDLPAVESKVDAAEALMEHLRRVAPIIAKGGTLTEETKLRGVNPISICPGNADSSHAQHCDC